MIFFAQSYFNATKLQIYIDEMTNPKDELEIVSIRFTEKGYLLVQGYLLLNKSSYWEWNFDILLIKSFLNFFNKKGGHQELIGVFIDFHKDF